MALILPGNVASATAGGYEVANSCRFFTDTVMKRTNASTSTNRQTGCFSTWIKKCNVSGTGGGIITGYVNSSNFTVIYFDGDHRLCFLEYQGGSSAGFLRTPNIFRDPSAWYHIAYLIDTTQGTAANRVKVYVNGTQITSFHSGGTTQPDEDNTLNLFTASTSLDVGQDTSGSPHFMNGYLAETLLVDGTAVAIGDLGEFDEDSPTIWKPKDISGISVGTNGFYLDYEDSSNLGNAVDGGTDLTETNLAATDQSSDSPTNNFCTMNPILGNLYPPTFSEGNLSVKMANDSYQATTHGTFAVNKGVWYWEVKFTGGTGIGGRNVGIQVPQLTNIHTHFTYNQTGSIMHYNYDGGEIWHEGTATTADYGTFAQNDIMGISLDMDNNDISFYKNGTEIIDDYSLGGAANQYCTPSLAWPSNDETDSDMAVNFGNPIHSLTSAVADANGYGSFEYTPVGLALCTKNLATDG